MRKKLAIFLALVVAVGSSTLIPTVIKRVFGSGADGGFQATPNAVPAYTGALTAVENSPEGAALDPYFVKGGGAINTPSANTITFDDRASNEDVHAVTSKRNPLSAGVAEEYPLIPVNDLAGFNYNDGSSSLPVEQIAFLPKGDNTSDSVPSSGPGGPFGGGLPSQSGGSPSGNNNPNDPQSNDDINNPAYSNQGSPKNDEGGNPPAGPGDNPPAGPKDNPPAGLVEQPPGGPTDTNYGLPPDKSFYDEGNPPGGGGDGGNEPTNKEDGLPQDNWSDDTPNRVPDSGTTLALFGTALAALACIRRKIS